MTLKNSLSTWAALRLPVVKPRTREYHQELIAFIGRTWPEKFDAPLAEIFEADVGEFVVRIAWLSDSRFNGIVTMLRAVVPAAEKLRRRRIRIKDRPLLSQLEFSRLLEELDGRPQSQAGLVIRFLSHTGLRIAEARKIRWQDASGAAAASWTGCRTSRSSSCSAGNSAACKQSRRTTSSGRAHSRFSGGSRGG